MEKLLIKNFAIHVLGCSCDNSVFDSIEKEENFMLNCGVSLKKKIIIGNRLLIYIAEADEIRPDDIKSVITEGISERNRMGYNRLRLAILTPHVSELAAGYLSEFGFLADKDDKTHIHIVSDENSI